MKKYSHEARDNFLLDTMTSFDIKFHESDVLSGVVLKKWRLDLCVRGRTHTFIISGGVCGQGQMPEIQHLLYSLACSYEGSKQTIEQKADFYCISNIEARQIHNLQWDIRDGLESLYSRQEIERLADIMRSFGSR